MKKNIKVIIYPINGQWLDVVNPKDLKSII